MAEEHPPTPFPRYERVAETALPGEPPPEAESPEPEPAERELEIPRTESYGELWRRVTARTLRSGN